MKAKLLKTAKGHYVLVDETKETYDKGFLIGNSRETIETYDKGFLIGISRVNKLSLKNCQAIERGYDLDELADEFSRKFPNDSEPIRYASFIIGFQKALEVNSDKRFTFKEMVDCWNKALNFQEHKETLGDHMQSLQQTEWDVEIFMEIYDDPDFIEDLNKEMRLTPKILKKPKLDNEGCIILKRI